MCYLLALLTAVTVYGAVYILSRLGLVDLSRFDDVKQPPVQE